MSIMSSIYLYQINSD